ncbi:MAG: EAL domain-containing protein, partial [Gammaproteobacteria bacterium]|nr:EAL domain-containing protein [Gammaproteobacteria bacterium]
LDRFKNINDSLGHHIGDQLLIIVADRLSACVRESDVVARIGGDEFIIALTSMNDNSQAAIIAEKILQNIGKTIKIDGHELNTSPSIGISIYPNDGDSVDELLRTADVAMYHAKEHGRNTYHYFTESMFIAANERIKIERELRVALHSEQLSLHYQPQISSADLKVIAMEALLRWNHPEQGMISPEIFIPIAEDAGIIYELGKWVIDESCRQLIAWKSDGFTGYRIAINLSTKQLQSESLADDIQSIMKKHQVTGNEMELEITETAAMSDPEQAIQQLGALRELGIQLSIDDFGTGYSSLAYLKQLPIQSLKLDKSFVHDIETDPNDAAICTATIALAHNLDLTVVAEGIETKMQLDFLTEHGCDYLQGYYFSKPLPADEMSEFLSQHKA